MVTPRFTVTAFPAVGANVVRSVSLREPFLSASRPLLPRLHVRVRVPASLLRALTRHQALSFLEPVVARWVMVPAPETVTFDVMRAPVRVTLCVMEATSTVAVGVGVAAGVGVTLFDAGEPAVGATLFDAGEAAVRQALSAARAVNE